MAAPHVLAIVLAGGEGKRLMPLTADRAKPAVPFGGLYRLVDFALSNLVNSRYLQIIVLTQYKSHSLDRHVARTWRMSPLLGNYVAPVPAQQRVGKHWYLGSADAIYQCLNIIRDEGPDIVVVVGADHVYRMDFNQMVDAHIESGAEFTVSAIRQPIAMADQFGVIDTTAEDPTRIAEFLEKPTSPKGLPDSPGEILASMGNYVANADALIEAVTKDSENPTSKHDMGGDIVPYFVQKGTAGVYDFIRNDVAGSTDRDRDYWRDVGTLDSYYDAHIDLISINPVFNLYNTAWPPAPAVVSRSGARTAPNAAWARTRWTSGASPRRDRRCPSPRPVTWDASRTRRRSRRSRRAASARPVHGCHRRRRSADRCADRRSPAAGPAPAPAATRRPGARSDRTRRRLRRAPSAGTSGRPGTRRTGAARARAPRATARCRSRRPGRQGRTPSRGRRDRAPPGCRPSPSPRRPGRPRWGTPRHRHRRVRRLPGPRSSPAWSSR